MTEEQNKQVATVPTAMGALVPGEAELNIYKAMATQAQESKFYQALGGLPGVMTIMLYARELGVPPMLALNQGFYNVYGRIEMSARLMNMLIRQRGHTLRIVKLDSETCTLFGKRADNDEEYQPTYTITDATRAGLVKKDSAWEKNPDDMLFARCISKLARRLFPDVIGTAYAEGEVTEAIGEPIDVTPRRRSPGRQPKKQTLLPAQEPTAAPEPEQTPAPTEHFTAPEQETTGEAEVAPEAAEAAQPAAETTPAEPHEDVTALLDMGWDWLNNTHKLGEKEGGSEFAEELIQTKFGVTNSVLVPVERLEELKTYFKGEMLNALEAKGFIPPVKRGA